MVELLQFYIKETTLYMLDDGGLVDPTRLIHVLRWVQFPHRLLFLHYDNAKK